MPRAYELKPQELEALQSYEEKVIRPHEEITVRTVGVVHQVAEYDIELATNLPVRTRPIMNLAL